MRKYAAFCVFILIVTMTATNCSGAPVDTAPSQNGEPVDAGGETGEPPLQMEPPTGVTIEGLAVTTMESFPVQFVATITGVITEPCLEVIDAYQAVRGFTLYVELATAPTGESNCPPPPTPFEIDVYLDSSLLEVGDWTVTTGGATATFGVTEADLGGIPPTEETPTGNAGGGGFVVYGLAMVDSVTPLVRTGPPVQVELHVQGNLNDGCTELDGVLQQRQGDTHILIYLQTQRPQDLMCTQALVPFETTIQLEGEFPPGDYTVTVNDSIEAAFTIE